MNIEKIKYCKCPNCKEYGIKAYGKVAHLTNYTVECKYCEKKYKVNWLISFFGKILVAIVASLIIKYVFGNLYSSWRIVILVIVVAILLYIMEYFIPMEELD